jgi:hypothetical protein
MMKNYKTNDTTSDSNYEEYIARYTPSKPSNQRVTTPTSRSDYNSNSKMSNKINNSTGGSNFDSFDSPLPGNSNSAMSEHSTTGYNGASNSRSTKTKKPNYAESNDTLSRSNHHRETLHSRFDFVRVLGKGTYGKVKLANDKRTGKQVIIY